VGRLESEVEGKRQCWYASARKGLFSESTSQQRSELTREIDLCKTHLKKRRRHALSQAKERNGTKLDETMRFSGWLYCNAVLSHNNGIELCFSFVKELLARFS
jgi:hypothetical protein